MFEVPPGAEVVTSFREYAKVAKAFFDGHYGLLILVGRPGLSKSWEFEKQLEARRASGLGGYYLRGMASPYKLYIQLYGHADEHIVLDDAEFVWGSQEGRILLRSLTEIKKPTSVAWEKENNQMKSEGIATSFKTSSPVCLICNKFSFGRSNEFEAIADRGQLVIFDPSQQEVHKYAASWFPKQSQQAKAVYDYIGQRLDYMPDLSFRVYTKSLQQCNAKRDWKRIIEDIYCAAQDKQLIIDLEKDKTLTPGERLRKYQEKARNNSQGAYYKYRREIFRHKQGEQ